MKISVITPSFNNDKYITECINSVAMQSGDFSIEHFVIDGASIDNTKNLLIEYENNIKDGKVKCKCNSYSFKWVSEKDKGMYDAILKGFKLSSGDIMAWINTDDLYQEGAFLYISDIFRNNSNIFWLKGITDYKNIDGSRDDGRFNIYNQRFIQKGVYGTIGPYIQQDSVFWRRALWDRVNYEEIRKYKYAGDFRLWQLFAKETKLFSFNRKISYFRKREGQITGVKMTEYKDEMYKTVNYSPIFKVFYSLSRKILRFFNLMR